MAYPDTAASHSLPERALRPLKRAIAREVTGLFNDRAKGETPVRRRPDGLFGPGSVAWRVHGDVVGMMTGGIAGLMMQMLHPAVLAGVWDHSAFRHDMSGRLRRTARFIALTTYGSREEAEGAIARVRRIHAAIGGTLPDGTPYRVDEPRFLAWVHVTECTTFLDGFLRYADPHLSAADADRYFAEMAAIGTALGADPVPRTRAEARALINAFRPELRADDRTREVAALINRRTDPVQGIAVEAGIDLLPDWARRLHAIPPTLLTTPLLRAGTRGVARTIRWAFS